MQEFRIFDAPRSKRFTEERVAFLRKVAPLFLEELKLETALDVGCGVGYFSAFLRGMGLQVLAIDGRDENVKEAQRRFPNVAFDVADVQNPDIQRLGYFDLVLCYGLLYHLENPFGAIRNLAALTKKVLLVECMCVPEKQAVLNLRDEGSGDDQSLHYVAFYPSESCLVKMLYKSGFPYVYRFKVLPTHEQFETNLWRKRARTMVAASKVHLKFSCLDLVPEPLNPPDPWRTTWAAAWTSASQLFQLIGRIWLFLRCPWSRKIEALRRCMRGVNRIA